MLELEHVLTASGLRSIALAERQAQQAGNTAPDSDNLVGSLVAVRWTTGWAIGTVVAKSSNTRRDRSSHANYEVQYDRCDDVYEHLLQFDSNYGVHGEWVLLE